MTLGRKIRIAGPQNELRIGPAVEHARTHLFVRQRVQDAVLDSQPRPRKRTVKASAKWPKDLSLDAL